MRIWNWMKSLLLVNSVFFALFFFGQKIRIVFPLLGWSRVELLACQKIVIPTQDFKTRAGCESAFLAKGRANFIFLRPESTFWSLLAVFDIYEPLVLCSNRLLVLSSSLTHSCSFCKKLMDIDIANLCFLRWFWYESADSCWRFDINYPLLACLTKKSDYASRCSTKRGNWL